MRILPLILLLTITILLSACDPFKADQITAQAEADRIAAQSEQDALNQAQNRAYTENLHTLQLQKEQMDLQRKAAMEQLTREILSIILVFSGIAVVFTIAMGTWSTVRAYQTAATGITHAIVQAAEIRSRLIYLDDGRQFPAILNQNMITDITTGQVTDTTQTHPGNPQAITGAIANRHVGIVAKETRRSKKDVADSVPLSQNPPVIEAKFSDVKEYYEMVMQKNKSGWDNEK